MEYEVEETGPVERKLRIEIPTADVDATFDAVYREIGRTAHLRGFRKGKAPRSVIERTYGSQARSEVLDRLVRDTLAKAVEEAELDIISEPRLEPEGEPKHGAPYTYQASLEVRPQIELSQVQGLEVTVPEAPEPDEDPVDQYLEELRGSHAQLVAEPEGTAIASGLIGVIDYSATIDGEPFEGGEGTEVEVEVGGGRAIPGFEEQLEGLEPGGEREFDLELPDAYPNPEAAGKTAHFGVKLLEVKRKELPELDDEFAKDVSDFETLDAFRGELQRRVDEGREAERERRVKDAVLEKLVEANPFPVPPSLVDRQLDLRISRTLQGMGGRIPPEDLREAVERWREEWREAAQRDVCVGLLLPEIARSESIEITDEDVDAQLKQEAEKSESSVSKLRREYKEKNLLEALRARILEDRVVEFLVSGATLSES